MRYRLSKFIPVRFRSTYSVPEAVHRVGTPAEIVDATPQRRQRATWWQYRGRIMRHRITLA